MTRDWLLTLLVILPALLTVAIVVLVLIRRGAQIELEHHRAVKHVNGGADQIEEVHGNLP